MSEAITNKMQGFNTVAQLGLAAAIAMMAVQHFMSNDAENDKFMREQMQANTEANTTSAIAMNRVVEEFDDLSDETRGVNARLDRLFPESFQGLYDNDEE